VELAPLRDEPDPVVLSGITVAPKHGVPVRVTANRPRASAGSQYFLGQVQTT